MTGTRVRIVASLAPTGVSWYTPKLFESDDETVAVCGKTPALKGLGPLMSAGKDRLLLVVLFIANCVGGGETRSVGAM